jgi:hypothetical protein
MSRNDDFSPVVEVPGPLSFPNDSLSGSTGCPDEWENIKPNFILANMKALSESLKGGNKKEFYKSPQYSNWEKMNTDQKNKTVAWFNLLQQSTKSKPGIFSAIFL